MKKKIGAVLTACLMSGAIVASVGMGSCVKKVSDFVMPAGGYDGSEVTITFANTTGQKLEPIVADAIKRFNVLYPNITVNVDRTNQGWDEIFKAISDKMTSDKQPNVAYCYSDHVAYYNQAGIVMPLDGFMPDGEYKNMTVTNTSGTESLGLTQAQKDDYVDVFFKEGRVYKDGKMYTLPLAKSTEVMFYNKTFFNKYEIAVPTTWKEMEKTCETIMNIVKSEDYPEVVDNGKKVALGYDSEANLFITMCEQYGAPYTQLDRYAEGGHYVFDNETTRWFVKMLKEWKDKRYLTTQELAKEYSSNLFTIEDCYISIGSSGGTSYQIPDSTDGEYVFEVGVAPIPQAYSTDPDHEEYKEGYTPKTILQGPSVCVFKHSNPQEVIASWLLVKFLTTDQQFQGRYSETSGYTPVTKSTFESEDYQDFLSEKRLTAQTANVCMEMALKGEFYTSPAFLGSSVARKQVGYLLRDYLAGSKTIDEAFRDALRECAQYQD